MTWASKKELRESIEFFKSRVVYWEESAKFSEEELRKALFQVLQLRSEVEELKSRAPHKPPRTATARRKDITVDEELDFAYHGADATATYVATLTGQLSTGELVTVSGNPEGTPFKAIETLETRLEELGISLEEKDD